MSPRGRWAPLPLTLGAATIVAAGVFAFLASRSHAGPAKEGEEAPAAKAQLPIGQVVLFSSGVGYFQREGTVEGNARVDLSFPVADINDLIKSMVLRDMDGGYVAAVACPYCTCERTCIVARLVRAFGPGWVIVKMRCQADGCRRVWHARMAPAGVGPVCPDDPEMDEEGVAACLRANGFTCPRCRGSDVQVPTEIGGFDVVGENHTPAGMALWCVCPGCEADYYTFYRTWEVVKKWAWHSPFRKKR
jgi:hypothetical protein